MIPSLEVSNSTIFLLFPCTSNCYYRHWLMPNKSPLSFSTVLINAATDIRRNCKAVFTQTSGEKNPAVCGLGRLNSISAFWPPSHYATIKHTTPMTMAASFPAAKVIKEYRYNLVVARFSMNI